MGDTLKPEEQDPPAETDLLAKFRELVYEDLTRSAEAGEGYDAVVLLNTLAHILDEPARPIPTALKRYFSKALHQATDAYFDESNAIALSLLEADADHVDGPKRSDYKAESGRLSELQRKVVAELGRALNLRRGGDGQPPRKRFLERLIYHKVISKEVELAHGGVKLSSKEARRQAISYVADSFNTSEKTIRRLIKPVVEHFEKPRRIYPPR